MIMSSSSGPSDSSRPVSDPTYVKSPFNTLMIIPGQKKSIHDSEFERIIKNVSESSSLNNTNSTNKLKSLPGPNSSEFYYLGEKETDFVKRRIGKMTDEDFNKNMGAYDAYGKYKKNVIIPDDVKVRRSEYNHEYQFDPVSEHPISALKQSEFFQDKLHNTLIKYESVIESEVKDQPFPKRAEILNLHNRDKRDEREKILRDFFMEHSPCNKSARKRHLPKIKCGPLFPFDYGKKPGE